MALTGGWRSIVPFHFLTGLGGGTVTPVAPIPVSPVTNRDLVSLLNIRGESQKIRIAKHITKVDPQTLSHALDAIQDFANNVDQRLRQLSGSVNSLGLPGTSPAGNIVFQGGTFTAQAGSEVFKLFNNQMQFGAPNVAPDDGVLPNGHVIIWIDEVGNTLNFRVRYSDGTLKTGSIPLV